MISTFLKLVFLQIKQFQTKVLVLSKKKKNTSNPDAEIENNGHGRW